MAEIKNKSLAQLFKDFLPRRINKEVSGQKKIIYTLINLKFSWENYKNNWCFQKCFYIRKKRFPFS